MRGSKSKILFIFTIIVGIITSLLVFNYLKGVKETAVEEVLTNIVVASQKVPQGTLLTAEMIKTIQVPVKYAPPGASTQPEAVVNQFANADLLSENVILTSQLASINTSSELPYKIPEGNRAITIAINPLSGVGGHIKPGHYVDILSGQASDKPEETKVYTLLQKVLVLAVGVDLQKKEGVQAAENVTLAVYPNEAQMIALTENLGNKIKLVLRPAADDKKVQLRSVNRPKLQALYP